jgi:hypothetical protein
MRQNDALLLLRNAGRIENRRGILFANRIRGADPSSAGGNQVLELEDPIVVPEVFLADRGQVLQSRQLGEQSLEELEVLDASEPFGRNDD